MASIPRTPTQGGGLNIPGLLGVSPREESAVSVRWDTLERVVETVSNWGFSEAEQPKISCPDITADTLLTPDPRQYTVMFEGALRWFNYANKLKARIVSEKLGVENEMSDIEALTRQAYRQENSKLTKEAVMDHIQTMPRYRELKVRLQELTQLKTEMDARCEELERTLRVVSRNIEIRKEEMGDGRKEQNMPGRMNRPDRFGRE